MATLILDEGTKINIVDDENKILDTGSTGKASTSSPPRMSFSESPWVSCVSCGRYTHAHAACHVGLNGGICIFYKLGVICIPGRAPPMLSGRMYVPRRDRHLRLAHVHQTDTGSSIYRPRSDVGSSDPLWSMLQSTLPFITSTHRYADEYRHEFN